MLAFICFAIISITVLLKCVVVHLYLFALPCSSLYHITDYWLGLCDSMEGFNNKDDVLLESFKYIKRKFGFKTAFQPNKRFVCGMF